MPHGQCRAKEGKAQQEGTGGLLTEGRLTRPALTGTWGVRERETRKQEREVLSRRGNKGSEIKTCLCQDSGNVYTVARELGATRPPTVPQPLALHPPPEWKTAPSKSYPFSRRTRDLLPSGSLSGRCVKQMGASLHSVLYIAIQNVYEISPSHQSVNSSKIGPMTHTYSQMCGILRESSCRSVSAC